MTAIYKKELRSYFLSPIGYVFIAVFLAFGGWFFTIGNLLSGYGDMSMVFGNMTTVFLFLIPILTMRSLAEEKNAKTDQLLLTAPIRLGDIVIGKVLAAVSVFMVALLITLIYPVILCFFTQPAWGEIIGNYIGFFLMGAAFVSIGVFISSLTENQIISAVCTFAILLLLFMIEWLSPSINNAFLLSVVDWLAITKRFNDFGTGIVDLGSVVYYLSIVAIFSFLTVRHLEKRRWSK